MNDKTDEVKEFVKERYGRVAEERSSCCGCGPCKADTIEQAKSIGYSEEELENIPESAIMGLGCGNPTALASLKEGERVLDLGAGAGIDVFLAANRVGEKGYVIGVDMTEEMIKRGEESARRNGYSNVEFRLGEIEDLPIEDESIDVVISNCVINLSPDKLKTFQETYRVLKPGGRMMISDLVTEGRLPEEIRKDFAAWAGCIGGALEKNEYIETIRKAGFKKVRIVAQNTYSEVDMAEELAGKITSVRVEAYKPG